MRSREQIISDVTSKFVQELLPENISVQNVRFTIAELLSEVNKEIKKENRHYPPERKLYFQEAVTFEQMALVLSKLLPFAMIHAAEGDGTEDVYLLGLYQEEGEKKGIYNCNPGFLERYVWKLCGIRGLPFVKRVVRRLAKIVPKKELCKDPNLIPVKNGIFDCTKKTLLPFSSDCVFTTKCYVEYHPDAHKVLIHNPKDNTDWDVDCWIESYVCRETDIPKLWKVLCNIIRPCDDSHRSAWFYVSDDLIERKLKVFCSFMQNLSGSCCDRSLRAFSNPLYVLDLMHSTAWIGFTRWAGEPIDTFSHVKEILSGKRLSVLYSSKSNRMKLPFRCFLVQFMNEIPRVKDKSNEIWKKQMFFWLTSTEIPKDEYDFLMETCVANKEVLEYVLHKVLHMIADLNDSEICSSK